MHGSGGGAWSALTAHAQQMDREGRQALQQFAFEAPDGANERPAPDGRTREQGAELRTLAQNAQQLLKALDGLAANAGLQPRPDAGRFDHRAPGLGTPAETERPRPDDRNRPAEPTTRPDPN